MRRGRPRVSTIALSMALAGGLAIGGVGTYQLWKEQAPVRAAEYIGTPMLWIEPSVKVSKSWLYAPEVVNPGSIPAVEPIKRIKAGKKVGTLLLPTLRQKFSVLQGTGRAQLALGVGHISLTALPGEGSNAILAGHRETVFSRLVQLRLGDRIEFWSGTFRHIYVVKKLFVVSAGNTRVTQKSTSEKLTLVTCYPFTPFGDSDYRYIVIARPI